MSTDAISAADDHVVCSRPLLYTFPNITGAMGTHTELNTVADGGTSATSTTLVSRRMVINDDGTMVQVACDSYLPRHSWCRLQSTLAAMRWHQGLSYPSADGSADQFLKTDGSGTLSFATPTGTFAMPAGMMFPYAGSSVPTGYLFCHGQAISRTTYADLFTAIGTTYGTGDGSSTFNLPDLRGRVIAGQDDMGGSSANRLTNQSGGLNGDTLGATGGAETRDLQLTKSHDTLALLTGTTVALTTGGAGRLSRRELVTANQPVSGNTGSQVAATRTTTSTDHRSELRHQDIITGATMSIIPVRELGRWVS